MLQRVYEVEKIIEAETVRAEEAVALARGQGAVAVEPGCLGDDLAELLAAIRHARRAGQVEQFLMVLDTRAIPGAHIFKIVECHGKSFRITRAKGAPSGY